MNITNLLLAAVTLLSLSNCTQSSVLERIYLVQVGPSLPAGKLAVAQRQLRATYNVPVTLLPPVALPESAFYAPRQRYRAQAILNHLAALNLLSGASHTKLIALTVEDIEVRLSKAKPHWGVMGFANKVGGQQAVISLHRLAGKDSRLQNVSVHEMGHLLGLKHCAGPKDNRCVMRDAEGSGAVVDHCSLDFCAACAGKLGL